ncbi:hypothetical protein G6F37_003323 [Rhizopus arrhizus]|nr:hypothetical protein G6F38_001785 [Rhizopus arrhizus]KAG1161169.1 hypothetical protein G6F37_003323 [Rhizopus arrhizus]
MEIRLDSSIEDVELRQSVKDLVATHPDSANVIERLISYYENKDNGKQVKRRKLDQNNQVFRLSDLSFGSPARKKYDLIITPSHLILYNAKLEIIESQYSLDEFALGACVPTPEKTNKSFTFVLFLKNEDCIVFNTQDKGDIKMEQANNPSQTLTGDKHKEIAQLLTTYACIPISLPSQDISVAAYLKAKDGYLFFLPTGILFGFKKPTLFFPLSSLAGNAFTSITQRTFDLVLSLKGPIYGNSGFKAIKEGEHETVEFSMISQEEFGPIDGYIKKAGINDQSMSEERRAPIKNNNTDEQNTTDKENAKEEDSEEEDENFEPSDNDDEDPLEYDTDAEEEENGDTSAQIDKEEEQDMLDESD